MPRSPPATPSPTRRSPTTSRSGPAARSASPTTTARRWAHRSRTRTWATPARPPGARGNRMPRVCPQPGARCALRCPRPDGSLYTRKHAPWTHFTNLNHANELPYSQLAADLASHSLPNLAFVTPDNCHNGHNEGCPVDTVDAWLARELPAMLAGVGPNGLVILTWDEDDDLVGNRILTVFAGPRCGRATCRRGSSTTTPCCARSARDSASRPSARRSPSPSSPTCGPGRRPRCVRHPPRVPTWRASGPDDRIRSAPPRPSR